MSLPVLPGGWSYRPIKRVADLRFSSVDKHTLPDEEPVQLCNYLDVYRNERITAAIDFMSATATTSERKRFALAAGDVLLTKDSEDPLDIGIPACVVEPLPGVVCGYHLAMLRPLPKTMDGKFLHRTLTATGIRDQFFSKAVGVTRFALGLGEVGDSLVPVPPLRIQQTIAAFLDRKTAAIDALIAKKERQVELLQEKRQALITQAVTKGLDPNAPMRKVRAPWFDRVPAHWAVTVVKRTATPEANAFTDGDWIEAPFVTDAGIRLLQTGNIGIGRFKEQGFRYVSESTFRELGCTEVRPGDVLICRLDGPVGRACLAPDLGCRMITSVDNAILRPSREFDAGFLVYVLSSQPYLDWVGALCRVGGGHRFRISRSMLGEFELPAPPVAEQREIRYFLDRTCQSINGVMTTVGRHVELLREYRQALVSAAVTGKIEIPDEEAA